MQRHVAFILGLGLAGMLVMTHRAAGQEKPPAAPAQRKETQPRPPVDAATRAMQREAEARAKERERMFGKIRGLKRSEAQNAVELELQRWRAEAEVAERRMMLIQARMAVLQEEIVIRGEAFAAEPEEPPDDQDDPEGVERENQPAIPLRQRNLIVASENFDQWIFSGDTIGGRRARLNYNLRSAIERLDPARRLTPVQRQKLELAGRGDIKHFFDQVEAKRREFEEIRNDVQKCRAFARTLRPLRRPT